MLKSFISVLFVCLLCWAACGFIACKLATMSGRYRIDRQEAKFLLSLGPFGIFIALIIMADIGDFKFIGEFTDRIGQRIADAVNKDEPPTSEDK